MRGRSYCQPRSRSGCCPPGCCLPCCAPRRRRRRRRCSPKVNPCIFIPAPGLTTKRYCGDPCSPPPPACTPKPAYMRRCSRPARRPRTSLTCDPCCDPCYDPCCDPCPPRRRPACSSSPRPYSRPYRPYSSLFSALNPCRPKKCGPLDPCGSSFIDRCLPCRPLCDPCPPRPVCDPCPPACTRFSPPCCHSGTKGNKSSKPSRRRSSSSPKTSKSPKSRSVRSSSRASSCCESVCSERRKSKPKSFRCKKCGYDPCSCKKTAAVEEDCRPCPNEDTSKAPTNWFVKQSEKCGKAKSSNEPHLCPWEAEVTVTGTVRGHCTSTAVEVAKRLTGKFTSRGQRYTDKKKNGTKRDKEAETKPQRMALGFLDDGTKLDFSRNRCEDDDADVHWASSHRTNNARTDNSGSASRRRSHRSEGKVKEKKGDVGPDLHFATAFVGGNSDGFRHGSTGVEKKRDRLSQCRSGRGGESSGHTQHGTHRHRRAWLESEASDTDQSLYKTAPESVQYYRHRRNSSQEDQNVYSARRRGRRKTGDRCTDKSRVHRKTIGRREDWWRQNNYHQTKLDDRYYYDEDDGVDEDVINFNLASEEDSDSSEDERGNDDIDKLNPHRSPPPSPTRHGRSRDRGLVSPVSYSRLTSQSRPQRHHRHPSRAYKPGRAAQHRPHSAYNHQDASSGQSSDEELRERGSPNSFRFKLSDRPNRHVTHHKYHPHHRKRVSYGEGL